MWSYHSPLVQEVLVPHANATSTERGRLKLARVAILPDEYGGYEEHHFLRIAHQIRRYRGAAWGAGCKVMTLPGTMEQLPWWKRAGLGKEQGHLEARGTSTEQCRKGLPADLV